ncbi:carbamoyl-phosphate synthase large chain [Mycolicibacterium phlei]|jgi:carbamoyl-phosphate synthase large subunit|uniref:Carbamoyl phosphate synthase large chain n=1 Tax=Mycolicibacterium phlei DSM 43239 = CCUG 21000 TaxID=1226750 RepID=A0A5N5VA37_MYCPH|nr:carbamoyl-phosphate synthase large subunit [Mycolicibacterium phlei]VEG09855.1 carbamoyl-phosphate synthase large chain [Mycobacteroides chelonae]AMO61748.1 Carbamoyl-phosphate synthase large chain [Mycolicibacterium phlei]EID11096.1 carbamoyl phosphate synthase large subunit [Mycolicibacterium phlei RIVM601174]KAB7758735.1 carbamoyl phosphate synthase large subunit [Mycolicibacterium phlei DSM 43239 = CCUG 21000]KXW67219.1 carbamoyl phosphate synthase large subunit [Mycolicibacterium phlei
MPRRTDLNHVLVIGSGPIVIGQAAEFDYSGTQACRVLRAEGLQVTLINSNPATIMTDPEYADHTYVEPITPAFVERVIAQQAERGNRIDCLLATLGGQTALNTAVALSENGVLEKYGVELIGADFEAIQRGEDRQKFKDIVAKVGGESARSRVCYTMDEVRETVAELGLPVVVRPSFTMGGLGSGMAYSAEDVERMAGDGLAASPSANVLIEESIFGWKEYELELMRDGHDNVVVVCSIENFDPMGVHTGDSVTVAPAMTLTDREYQKMRDLGIAILREVGVDTGGCNIQFAVNPRDGRLIVIEMNPRVSRSSALASKATGFPIAKIAAKLAIGYTLDEIVNDITKETPACFEPTLDYVVVKAPRFAFEKFPGADGTLTTTMKSVGEAMSLGRNFIEALGKVMRSLETKRAGFWTAPDPDVTVEELLTRLGTPTDGRLYDLELALRKGATVEQVAEASGVDPWFVDQIAQLVALRNEIVDAPVLDADLLRRAKYNGLSDRQIAALRPELAGEVGVRALRERLGIHPVYKTVDTCAAEFEAKTPYHYSSYELDPAAETEVAPQTEKPKVMILGSGPNRIGQGIEFDYSCVHAATTLSQAGYETIMVNCNPETVSTDYDTADRLYFEPLTFEDVLEVYYAEQASGAGGPGVVGVIVQLGGQTPLGLAERLQNAGVPIVGTSPKAIDLAEDRGHFGEVLTAAGLPAPKYGMATSFEQARRIAADIGYPVLVRPSYVLGGRGMEIVYDDETLHGYITRATELSPEHPVLVDRFLEDAIEIDVDALCDGTEVYIGGIMEHIEEAGIHSGDSACALPPVTLGRSDIEAVRRATEAIAHGIGVVGLLNVQYALKDDVLYVLEANPRASRTVPFVSKATAVPLAKACARIMLGASIAQLREEGVLSRSGDGASTSRNAPVAVKEAVLPFHRFRKHDGSQIDSLLGPEMKSTGEVMGIDHDFGSAFAKSQTAAYGSLPTSGTVFVSVANRDKRSLVFPVKRLADLGFRVLATEGTAEMLRRNGIPCDEVRKHFEEPGEGKPASSAVDVIKSGQVDMVINTPYGNSGPRVDGYEIRSAAVANNIPCVTTVQGASAAVQGIEAGIRGDIGVMSLQELHSTLGS